MKYVMGTGSNFLTIKHITKGMIILSCLLLVSCSQRFYFFNNSSSDMIFKFSNDEMEINIRIDIRSLDINHNSLTWNNTIRIKVDGKTQDAKVLINEIHCEMVGKKANASGVINPPILKISSANAENFVDFPLFIYGNEAVEFYIPVTFEYNKSIGSNHRIVLNLNNMLINNEAISIQPLTFFYSKSRK